MQHRLPGDRQAVFRIIQKKCGKPAKNGEKNILLVCVIDKYK